MVDKMGDYIRHKLDNKHRIYPVKGDYTEIATKRLYLPINFNKRCTRCGALCKANMSNQYLSDPIINRPEEYSIFCEYCDDWFEVDIVVRMQIEVLPNAKEEGK